MGSGDGAGERAGDGAAPVAASGGAGCRPPLINLPLLLPTSTGAFLPPPTTQFFSPLRQQVKPGEIFQEHILSLFHCPVIPSVSVLGPSNIHPTPIWLCASPSRPHNSLSVKNILNFWFSSYGFSFSVSSLGFGLFRSFVANRNVASSLVLAGSALLDSAGLSIHLSKDSTAVQVQNYVDMFLVHLDASAPQCLPIESSAVPASQTAKPGFNATSCQICFPPPPTSRNSSTAASSLALKLVNSTAATSFKDALLSQKNPRINQSSNPSYQSFRQNKKPNMLNRCFRCLGLDHHVKDCRDPLICASCRLQIQLLAAPPAHQTPLQPPPLPASPLDGCGESLALLHRSSHSFPQLPTLAPAPPPFPQKT